MTSLRSESTIQTPNRSSTKATGYSPNLHGNEATEYALAPIIALVNVEPTPEWARRLHFVPGRAPAAGRATRAWVGRAVQRSMSVPIQDETGSITLVYHGHLSGHHALRARLERLGVRFTSDNAGEIILRAYQAFGESVPEQIDGPCAFILWDAQAQRLLAVRDRLGTKRLYLAEQDGGLILATDIRILLALRHRAGEPDPQAVAHVLALGYIPGSASIWKGISKVDVAEIVIWDSTGGLRRRRYWEPPRATGASGSTAGWGEVFEEALDRICPPGEPVGLMLSAGLDSSSIALGLRRLGRPVKALTFSAAGERDESSLGKTLAQHLKMQHVAGGSIDPEDIGSLLDSVVPTLEEPPCHHSILTSHVMCRAAADHFAVLLTGDGAEESLGGREWYSGTTVNEARQPLLQRRSLSRRLYHAFVRGISSRRTARVHRSRGALPLERLDGYMRPAIFSPEQVSDLLAPSGVSFSKADVLRSLLHSDAPTLPLRRRLQRLDLLNSCANVEVPKMNQPALAYGLDLRLPFLDRRVVEWAIEQPIDEREYTERKPVLRDYLRGHVPDAIVDLPKHGLNPSWSLPVESAIQELRDGYWVRNGYWVPDVEQYVRPGDSRWRSRLWRLYLLERWAAYWLP